MSVKSGSPLPEVLGANLSAASVLLDFISDPLPTTIHLSLLELNHRH